jgi:sugar phosphate isomerase/epimerase
MLQLATKFKPDADEPFEIAVAAGMHCAELWTGPDVLEQWEAVVERARRFDLRYALHFPTKRTLTERHFRAFVELYRALDCRAAVIHQLEWDKYAAEVLKLAPDLVLAVENSFLTRDEFRGWETGHKNLTLDAEHVWLLTLGGAAIADVLEYIRAFLARNGSKVRHVHLPGYYFGLEEHRPMYCSRDFVLPVLSLLDDVGFNGFVVSEIDVPYQNVNDIRMDVLLFDTWRTSRSAARRG